MLAFLALVLDVGNAYAQRRQMQNAADAGALAGARELAIGGTTSDVQARATEYAVQRNGADSCTVTIAGDTVTVTTTRTFDTFFARVIGIHNLTAGATGSARFGTIRSMQGGVYPIAANWNNFVYGQTYDIFAGGGSGNFGWVGWQGSPSGSILCTSLTPPGDSQTYVNPDNPADHVIDVGDWLPGTTGVINNQCVNNNLDYFISTATPITIIIWDQVRNPQGSNLDYRVAGFAEFILVSQRLPSENRITGRFIRWVVDGDWGSTTYYGVSIVRLTP
jgi:hypothetical protein